MIAAIGTDARRPVIWGIGRTERAALADAAKGGRETGCDPAIIGTAKIDSRRAQRVRDGDVDASDLVVATPSGMRIKRDAPGRPPLPADERRVRVDLRLPAPLLGAVDASAEEAGETRTAAVERLLAAGLKCRELGMRAERLTAKPEYCQHDVLRGLRCGPCEEDQRQIEPPSNVEET